MSGLRERIARWIAPGETRAGWGYSGPLPSFTLGGAGTVPVQPFAAQNLSTVVACVDAIGQGLGSLPARVFLQADDGRTEANAHPVARLVRRPNRYQSWPDWCQWSIAQLLLWGNSLSLVEYDAAGRPTSLSPIEWRRVASVALLPSGRLQFQITGRNGEPVRTYFDDELFHLRDYSDDGILGRSRLSRAPDVLGAAIGLQTYSAAIWANSATPSGILELPPNISPEGVKRLEAFHSQKYQGADNAKRIMYVDKDTKFTPLSISPEDAEVLASRKFSVEEICRLFNVPPPIVQDYSHNTFTNSAQASLWFASNTLAPIARKIEAEFARSVFSDPTGRYHLEIDLSGMVRGDYLTRWQANVAAVGAGILTVDEVREQEGYGPLPAGPAAPGQIDAEPPGEPGDIAE